MAKDEKERYYLYAGEYLSFDELKARLEEDGYDYKVEDNGDIKGTTDQGETIFTTDGCQISRRGTNNRVSFLDDNGNLYRYISYDSKEEGNSHIGDFVKWVDDDEGGHWAQFFHLSKKQKVQDELKHLGSYEYELKKKLVDYGLEGEGSDIREVGVRDDNMTNSLRTLERKGRKGGVRFAYTPKETDSTEDSGTTNEGLERNAEGEKGGVTAPAVPANDVPAPAAQQTNVALATAHAPAAPSMTDSQIQTMMQQRHANRTARKEQRMLERAQKAAESEQQKRTIDDSNIGVTRPAINIGGLQSPGEDAKGVAAPQVAPQVQPQESSAEVAQQNAQQEAAETDSAAQQQAQVAAPATTPAVASAPAAATTQAQQPTTDGASVALRNAAGVNAPQFNGAPKFNGAQIPQSGSISVPQPTMNPRMESFGVPNMVGSETLEKPVQPAPEQTAVRNYDDLYATLMQQQMEQYNKDAEALARRRRSQEAIGSISDAAGAVANLIATNNYAPNQQVQTPMSAKARERYDRARAELDKSNAQQMAFLNQMDKARKSGNDATYRQMLMDWRNNETARKAAATEQQYVLLLQKADLAQQKLDAMIKNNADKNDIARQKLEVDRLRAQVYSHNAYYGKPQYDVYEETVEHDPITDTDKTKVTKKTYTKSENGGKKHKAYKPKNSSSNDNNLAF